jgi:hypothetical protein
VASGLQGGSPTPACVGEQQYKTAKAQKAACRQETKRYNRSLAQRTKIANADSATHGFWGRAANFLPLTPLVVGLGGAAIASTGLRLFVTSCLVSYCLAVGPADPLINGVNNGDALPENTTLIVPWGPEQTSSLSRGQP